MKKKSLTGWIINNWGMVFRKTGITEDIIIHDTIYKKSEGCVKTKVRVTIEEIL